MFRSIAVALMLLVSPLCADSSAFLYYLDRLPTAEAAVDFASAVAAAPEVGVEVVSTGPTFNGKRMEFLFAGDRKGIILIKTALIKAGHSRDIQELK
jgi:hypothetical protein